MKGIALAFAAFAVGCGGLQVRVYNVPPQGVVSLAVQPLVFDRYEVKRASHERGPAPREEDAFFAESVRQVPFLGAYSARNV